MGTIAENLQIIKDAASEIKQAIIDKGGVIRGDITTWANAIRSIGVINYLAFTAEEDNSTISLNAKTYPDIKYSLNGGEWTQWNYSAITLNTGDTVYMKGDNSNGFSTSTAYNRFQMTGKIGASGNIMSLLYDDDFEGKLTIPRSSCYRHMFLRCTSLTTAPELPATALTASCYQQMFNGCTSLTTAPELPATTLAKDCYNSMFYGCTSLTAAPELPATTLTDKCYCQMFEGCSSLVKAPELLATTLAERCYYGMFRYCGSLTTAPELPAMTLANYCYSGMFNGCNSLTTAPELPATILAEGCYVGMFEECGSLTTAPELPATALTESCYQQMFNGCTSLTTAPELPAMTLANYCYQQMFNNCTSLTTAPELPATILAEGCYVVMFENCSKLNYIKMLATDISASYCLDNWVGGVASTGTFIKHLDMTSLPTGVSGIPEGWTVQDWNSGSNPDSEPKYLTFMAEEDNSTISLSSKTNPDIKYSLNEGEWIQWDYSAITLNTGDTVRMKGNNSNGFSTGNKYRNQFNMTGKIGASGNIMSLLYEDDFEGKLTIPCDYCYSYMFKNCTSLTTAPELPATTLANYCYQSMFNGCKSLATAPELPATTLANYCYQSMFQGCTSLTTDPELPANTLAEGCYTGMFMGCTSLTTAPELPATTLANYCYQSMFQGCTSLTAAPEILPANTLAEGCYNSMFWNCTSLTAAPELPATTLAKFCYTSMFSGCNNLNYIKMLATNIRFSSCLDNWVDHVASIGTFIKHPDMTSLPTGTSGIPSGWTVEDAVIS